MNGQNSRFQALKTLNQTQKNPISTNLVRSPLNQFHNLRQPKISIDLKNQAPNQISLRSSPAKSLRKQITTQRQNIETQ